MNLSCIQRKDDKSFTKCVLVRIREAQHYYITLTSYSDLGESGVDTRAPVSQPSTENIFLFCEIVQLKHPISHHQMHTCIPTDMH